MTTELITVDTILESLKSYVEEKQIIAPSAWLAAAQKLNALLGDEHDKLFALKQKVANLQLAYLDDDEKRNVSAARLRTQATDEYKEMLRQEAKIKRVEEMIRLGKAQARLKDNEMRGY